jgi:hypothetical protein
MDNLGVDYSRRRWTHATGGRTIVPDLAGGPLAIANQPLAPVDPVSSARAGGRDRVREKHPVDGRCVDPAFGQWMGSSSAAGPEQAIVTVSRGGSREPFVGIVAPFDRLHLLPNCGSESKPIVDCSPSAHPPASV